MADMPNQPANAPAAPAAKPDAGDQALTQMYGYFDRDDIRRTVAVTDLDALKAA